MNINEIKDLMAQFDQSSLREFSYKNQQDELTFSKNEGRIVPQEVNASPLPTSTPVAPIAPAPQAEVVVEQQEVPAEAAPAPKRIATFPEAIFGKAFGSVIGFTRLGPFSCKRIT